MGGGGGGGGGGVLWSWYGLYNIKYQRVYLGGGGIVIMVWALQHYSDITAMA